MSDYFTEIEGHFALRRGTVFVLSAKDWALMKKWHTEGVPLPVVIEAIDSVFERNEASGRRKVISSLSYCRHAVKELWDERRELQIGDAAQSPEAAPGAMLEELAGELERVPGQAAQKFAVRVRDLAREKSVPRIEERLIETEHELMSELAESLSEQERAALEHEIATLLGDASRVDEKTRQRTREAHLRRLIRERFGLPRLTLFR